MSDTPSDNDGKVGPSNTVILDFLNSLDAPTKCRICDSTEFMISVREVYDLTDENQNDMRSKYPGCQNTCAPLDDWDMDLSRLRSR